MLYIGAKDIEAFIDLNEMMDCIEEAFLIYASGKYQMPNRMHVDRPQGTILYMPCFTDDVSGTKIVSTFPGNTKKGIPTIQGTMVLNNSKTGEPLAIIDGAMVTAYRTGAVGGVGIRHTCRKNCESLGLIGTGVQGFYQVLYACKARPIKIVTIFNRSYEKSQVFKDQLEKKLQGVHIQIARNSVDLLKASEIIITATPAKVPVLPDDPFLLKGKHIIAIGSYKYEMRELPRALYEILDDLYMDTEAAASESGDLMVPIEEGWFKREDMQVFGQAYKSLIKSPLIEERTTLFKSVGMALFDLLIAERIYEIALQKKKGVFLGECDE